jgi:UDP-N-acetylmuramoylalanine--D-glutamate ligase
MVSIYGDFFKNKKITLMGLGLLGRGIGDAKFLAEIGAELIVTDMKSETELKDAVDVLSGFSNITFSLGGHKLEDFQNRDMIIRASNVPHDSPFLLEAEKNNTPIHQSTALFAKLSPAIIVGVTGTRGKTTTTYLIYEILKHAGKKVFLGGNIQGVSTLAHLPESTADEIAVLELDSWQLQSFGDLKLSPHIAVFTNLLPDHLNYYKGDVNQYLRDKANIFLYQKDSDVLILGESMPRILEKAYDLNSLPMKRLIASHEDVPTTWKPKLLGRHNHANIACAIEATRALEISEEVIQEAVENFAGVEGRFQKVKEVNGVEIYNDTTATTPDATRVALETLSEQGKQTVLIMGGADKTLDMSKLVETIPTTCRKVILLPGTGTDKFLELLDRPNEAEAISSNHLKTKALIVEAKTLNEAVAEAVKIAVTGDVILFSPAFASFGMFVNEYDRGEKFMEIIKDL